MKDKFEVVFINEFDPNIFDEYFFKRLLSNVVNLMKKKEEKLQNDCRTCACLEQAKQQNATLTCACHRQVEDKSFGSQA